MKINTNHRSSKSYDVTSRPFLNFSSSTYGDNFKYFSKSKPNIQDKNLPPIDDYYMTSEKLMTKYKYDGDSMYGDNSSISYHGKTKKGSFSPELEQVKDLFRKSQKMKEKEKLSNEAKNDETKIKIYVTKDNFRNPFQSLEVIKSNKKIFEELTRTYESREFFVFRQTQLVANKITSKPKKVKITNLIPKNEMILNHHMESKNENKDDTNIKLTNIRNSLIPNNVEDQLKMHGYYVYPSKNFPESRQQFSFTYDCSDILLFGGFIANKSNYLWSLDPSNMEWNKIIPDNLSANLRFGHTGVMHGKKYYLFGGKYVSYPVFGDIEIFNVETKLWTTPSLLSKYTLKLRRNHIAIGVGSQMFIHGGVSEDEEYLNDSCILNYNPLKWVSVNIKEENFQPTLAFHSAVLVLPKEQKYSPKLSLYKLPELGISKKSLCRIKEKGIYVFGGKSSERGELNNDMWVIRIGKKPLEWVQLDTNGTRPSPRYLTSLNFYEEGNFVIIHGGSNDQNVSGFSLNDTYLLELYYLDWVRVDINFELKSLTANNRCGHSAIVYSNKLIIFGGMNSDNYLGSRLFLIDLDSHTKCKKEIEEMDNIVDNIVSNEEYIVKQAPKRRISIQNYDTLPNIK